MSERLSSGSPPEWIRCTLGELCRRRGGSIQTGPFGSELHAEDYKDEGTPIITVEHLREGKILHDDLPLVGKSDSARLGRYSLSEGDLVFSRVGAIDRCAFVTELEHGWLFSGRCLRVRPSNGDVNPKFLAYSLNSWQKRRWILNHSVGSTMACLNTSIISAVPIDLPSGPEQYRIAEILSTLDETIEQTEMVIAKYQQMKAGLMQDLFTRGVTPDGRLRPIRIQAPHLYNESPVGWIPKEWGIERIDRLAESLVDGPFGSNLKTEHYVAEPGVRVVRLQNIEDGNYNDRDRAFVSIRHAEYLARNQVKPGDVLIAGLGEDNNVVGRACCYPDGLPNAINKADCFRLRCRETRTFNAFVMHFLNTSGARQQIRRFEQGVTRRRINTTNLRKVTVGLPTKTEQESIITILSTVAAHLAFCVEARTKLQQQKLGLMHDLLTARVRVKATESEEVLA